MHIFYPIGSNLLVFSTEKRTKDSNSRNNDNLDKVTKICFVSTWASSHKTFFFFGSKLWNPNTSDCGEKCNFLFPNYLES